MEKGSLDCLNILCTKKKNICITFYRNLKCFFYGNTVKFSFMEPLFLILYDLMHFSSIQIWLIVNILSDLL